MEKNKYKDLVARHTPKEPRLYHGMIAFLTGGMMGVIGQFLIDVYSYYFHIVFLSRYLARSLLYSSNSFSLYRNSSLSKNSPIVLYFLL